MRVFFLRLPAPWLLWLAVSWPAGVALAAGGSVPASIQASVDESQPYVQAQVVLTLRISYDASKTLADTDLSELQMSDADVQRVGPARHSRQVINGHQLSQVEVRYAIYPQHSGPLSIPGLEFSAIQLNNMDDEDTLFPFGRRLGTRIELRSPGITLQVRPKPAGYPKDAPWLPARSLSLSESWKPLPNSLRVGDSVTRTLRLRAQGLTAPQLPPLALGKDASLRDYADSPTLLTQTDPDGLTGVREESHALIPTKEGELRIPDFELVWWNTKADRLEHSRLPGRILRVAANPEQAGPPPEPQASSPAQSPALWPWQLSTLTLGLTTLLGFLLFWRARWVGPHKARRKELKKENHRQLLAGVQAACSANDPQTARRALDQWARAQTQTLAALARHNPPLAAALEELNKHLYGDDRRDWQGRALWQALSKLPGPANTKEPPQSSLPPLYPP